MANDLVLNAKPFENIYAIETNYDNKDNRSRESNLNYIFDPNEYLEEETTPYQYNNNSSSRNTQIKQSAESKIDDNKEIKLPNGNINSNKKIKDEPFAQTLDVTTDIDTKTNTNKNTNFNFVAVGDWDCNGEAEDTVENIIDKDPELILALGDFSYNGKAKCWLKMIKPIADKTKIVIGNHEVDSSKLLRNYMDFFGLEKQYYSFNYKNMHFLALSTETDYDEDSEQYQFAIRDLEKYSKDPFMDWIVVFYHDHIYGSGSLEEETDFREIYHPLFDKYKVDLALQGHLHVYERTYPITFNNEDGDEPIVHNNNNNNPNINNNLETINLTTTLNNDKDENAEFLDQYNNPNIYKNPKGPIFVTVGTGGAHDMALSSLEDYSAEGIDNTFGILDVTLESDQKTLTGTFIENGKKKEVMDEFKIIKDNNT
ncbi:MAG TPA: metallophosphoesterase [Nitrososphaeraceae archaeon]|nr:metallophosphoesterase [Nitrososphaeraceae archaeon]